MPAFPPPRLLPPAVQQRTIEFKNLQMKDNVAQLVAFEQRSSSRGSREGGAGGPDSSQTSSEGSAGSSRSGQKRRAAEAAGAGSSAPTRHLRFDSSSESEGEGASAPRVGGGKRRGGLPGGAAAAAAAAAALQSATMEDAVAAGSGSRGPRVEDATERAESDMELESDDEAAARQLPALLVANIHVLFNPRRGDLKMGQVRCGAGRVGDATRRPAARASGMLRRLLANIIGLAAAGSPPSPASLPPPPLPCPPRSARCWSTSTACACSSRSSAGSAPPP